MMLDLLIKQGRTIAGLPIELGIKNRKIVLVGPRVDEEALKVIDLKNESYISAGWIDDHVHCYEEMELYYDYPDEIGVKTGVTTVIDAGTTGAENIGDFYRLASKARTNVFALINISKWGIVEQDELADLTKLKADLIETAIAELPDFIVGLKARMSKTVVGDNGIRPLQFAKEIQRKMRPLPLMVHIGSAPPELSRILDLMGEGDILTHCFNGKANGIIDQMTGEIKATVWDGYRKGICFDIGHGTDSFNFLVAEKALKKGLKATSISTDIYIRNRKSGPVFDLATTMEKLHVVGYSWPEIIERVTSAPAEQFSLKSKGRLAVGFDADITVFDLNTGEKKLVDANGNQRVTRQLVVPQMAIVGGRVYDC